MLVKTRKKTIMSPDDVHYIFVSMLDAEDPADRNKEHFWSVGLNSRSQILFIDLVHLGSITESTCDVKCIFRLAIEKGVTGIICVHNHPSGNPSPSQHDMNCTIKLANAGEILDIKVLDHVIVSNDSYYSFSKESGYL